MTERPFERYFLFGIDEERTTKLRKDKEAVVDDYLSHANKIIVHMMFTLPQFPKGLENLWKDVPGPFPLTVLQPRTQCGLPFLA